MLFYWFLKFVAIGPVVQLRLPPAGRGHASTCPATGAAILASNHLSAADWIFMPLSLKRRVTFLAKAEYFTGTGVKGFLQRVFFAGSGQVPIDRTERLGRRGRHPHRACASCTRASCSGIYPEGTRSPDGRLYRGKTGVARMALETGAPVIPVAMVYSRRKLPFGRKMPARSRCASASRWTSRRYEGLSGDRFVERSITDEIMYEIMTLSGQEYVDVYGATVKKSMDDDRRQRPRGRREAAAAARGGRRPRAEPSPAELVPSFRAAGLAGADDAALAGQSDQPVQDVAQQDEQVGAGHRRLAAPTGRRGPR